MFDEEVLLKFNNIDLNYFYYVKNIYFEPSYFSPVKSHQCICNRCAQ